jgi:hypothetical protein
MPRPGRNYTRKAKDQTMETIKEDRRDFVARKLYQSEDVLLKSAKRENHSAMIGAIRLQCDLAQVLQATGAAICSGECS